MRSDFYVYTYAYPDGTVFYVGKGKGNRILAHEGEARRGKKSYKCNVIRQIWSDGGQVIKTKIQENMLEEDAYRLEIDLIRMYGREHLTNLTDGGEGVSCGEGEGAGITIYIPPQCVIGLQRMLQEHGEDPAQWRKFARRYAKNGIYREIKAYMDAEIV